MFRNAFDISQSGHGKGEKEERKEKKSCAALVFSRQGLGVRPTDLVLLLVRTANTNYRILYLSKLMQKVCVGSTSSSWNCSKNVPSASCILHFRYIQ